MKINTTLIFAFFYWQDFFVCKVTYSSNDTEQRFWFLFRRLCNEGVIPCLLHFSVILFKFDGFRNIRMKVTALFMKVCCCEGEYSDDERMLINDEEECETNIMSSRGRTSRLVPLFRYLNSWFLIESRRVLNMYHLRLIAVLLAPIPYECGLNKFEC